MNNRINFNDKNNKVRKINKFFLPCDLKPHTKLWKSTIADFCYDIVPAFTFGVMGLTAYKPDVYSIIKTGGDKPIFGYCVTITNPETIVLLDRLKSFYGPGTVNINVRWPMTIYLNPETITEAWVYVYSESVLQKFETIEVVTDGFWDFTDEGLFDYMDKLSK